jgi:hypothetical protein
VKSADSIEGAISFFMRVLLGARSAIVNTKSQIHKKQGNLYLELRNSRE